MTSRAVVGEHNRVAVAAWALALLLVTTGTLHFTSPAGFKSIVLSFVGSPSAWVILSGVAELACSAALIYRRTRRIAGWACVVLFVVVYPANITMAVRALNGHGNVLTALLRLPLQVPLIAWALYIAHPNSAPGMGPGTSHEGTQ